MCQIYVNKAGKKKNQHVFDNEKNMFDDEKRERRASIMSNRIEVILYLIDCQGSEDLSLFVIWGKVQQRYVLNM